MSDQDPIVKAAGHDTQIILAEARTERAEGRTEQAEARTEQAKTRTELAETRTEQAETRTELAKTRTEQAEARSEQAEARSEEAVRNSEFNYRRLFEAAREGILILGADTGRIRDVNPFLTEMLGFSHDELLSIPIWELGPFKDIFANQGEFEHFRQQGYVRTENLSLETRAGQRLAVEFVSHVYQAGNEKIIQCTVRDISERKRAETASCLLAAIVESSADAIYAKDLNNVVTSWNKGAEQIFGFSAGEMLGASILRLVPTERQEEENDILRRIKAGESVAHIETLRKMNGGRLIEVSITSSAIKDATGRVVGVSKVARDITQRKLAENSLRESEEKFRQIAETINEVVWITNASRQKMIYVSPAYEKIWGRSCKSLYESPGTWQEAIRPEDRERVANAARSRLAKGEYDEVYCIRRPDGSLRWIHDRAVPLRNAAGEIIRFIGTAGDVTENRKLEDAFRQAQKMESIGQLAGGIAHDFNNILSAIIGNIYLLQSEAANHPGMLETLENISAASRRATELVKQVLTFSRKGRPEREAIFLNEVVLEALKLLRSSVPTTIRIQTELAATPTVLANASSVHQVIMNLGTNAWHAMGNQTGTLKVSMAVMEVDENFAKTRPDLHPGRYVQLSVSDTGIGMDRATLEHIFEPFFTTKAVGEGTGLGLAVVHGIMKSHDGGISVYSQPGEGTTFHLYFPVIETESSAREIEAAPIPRGQGEYILFVDDEEALASLGKKVLERLGYRVMMKTSALEAMAAVRDQPEAFDLVITDLTMPVMDGAKLGSQLLLIRPGLPVLISTGYSSVMTDEKARELGFRELLSKPITARILGEAVHRVLQSEASTQRHKGVPRGRGILNDSTKTVAEKGAPNGLAPRLAE